MSLRKLQKIVEGLVWAVRLQDSIHCTEPKLDEETARTLTALALQRNTKLLVTSAVA
jgi:hypothetical protein